jgi:hypothetical protein
VIVGFRRTGLTRRNMAVRNDSCAAIEIWRVWLSSVHVKKQNASTVSSAPSQLLRAFYLHERKPRCHVMRQSPRVRASRSRTQIPTPAQTLSTTISAPFSTMHHTAPNPHDTRCQRLNDTCAEQRAVASSQALCAAVCLAGLFLGKFLDV